MVVRIECQQPDVIHDLIPKRLQISPGRIHRQEPQRGQMGRRVVDEHDRRAARAAILEPGVWDAVDLDQFAKPRTAYAKLMDSILLSGFRAPQFQPYLGVTHRFGGYRYALALQ